MLRNGSFEEGWTDLPPAGFLVNQQPNHWQLHWIEPGESLFGVGDVAGGVPECVHKLAEQLPPNEQPGGSHALILDGHATYKIFHSGAAFGAELRQTITGLRPGSAGTLTVPVLVALNGESDPFGAESGVWVNGEGRWANGSEMGDRHWFRHIVPFTATDGAAEVIIRVKSKWPRPKDFFIDGVTLVAIFGPDAGIFPPGPPFPPDDPVQKVQVRLPEGYQLVIATSTVPGTVIVSAPEGVVVEQIAG